MKASLMLILILGGMSPAIGQEAGFASSATLSYDAPVPDWTAEAAPSISLETGVPLELKGPLVVPLKSRSLWRVPGNFLKLINPFAPTPTRVEHRTTGGRLSAQPWATLAGWSPGRSAFPDERTHVPTLSLLSVQRR
jgi:hypothetical protein